jgi:RNA polymerase sigma-70 factor (ECF subfamily)
VAIDMVRRERRVRGHDEVVLEGILVEEPEAPDLAHLKRTHGEDLRSALADGIAGLEAEDQLMLRLHYVDGLSTGKIAAMQRQHPVTVLRRLGRVRAQLLKHIKRFMRTRCGVSGSQLDSIVRLVQSDFHARLSGMLAEAPTVLQRRPRE